MKTKIGVVYLAREAVAVDPFIRAWKNHLPGVFHELVWLRKGRNAPDAPDEPFCDRVINIGDYGQSLFAFRQALDRIQYDYDYICYLNSWSRPSADNWLAKLVDCAAKPFAGLCGATASCESFSNNQQSLFGRMIRRPFFTKFPNPHIRTTGFCAKSEVLQAVWPRRGWGHKSLEHMHEAGRWSISRRSTSWGFRNWIVGKSFSMPHDEWCWSQNFFRANNYSELIIEDNQTDAYLKADRDEKDRLEHRAWGREWYNCNPMLKRIPCVNQ